MRDPPKCPRRGTLVDAAVSWRLTSALDVRATMRNALDSSSFPAPDRGRFSRLGVRDWSRLSSRCLGGGSDRESPRERTTTEAGSEKDKVSAASAEARIDDGVEDRAEAVADTETEVVAVARGEELLPAQQHLFRCRPAFSATRFDRGCDRSRRTR